MKFYSADCYYVHHPLSFTLSIIIHFGLTHLMTKHSTFQIPCTTPPSLLRPIPSVTVHYSDYDATHFPPFLSSFPFPPISSPSLPSHLLPPSLFLPSMAAILNGPIVLENPTTLEGYPSTVLVDGQMWLGSHLYLKGSFRYYNASRTTFSDIGRYFACIIVCDLFCLLSIVFTFFFFRRLPNFFLPPIKENRNNLLIFQQKMKMTIQTSLKIHLALHNLQATFLKANNLFTLWGTYLGTHSFTPSHHLIKRDLQTVSLQK